MSPNPKIKYALVPGQVTSRSDGDTHFINSRRLADLYSVDFRECVEISLSDRSAGIETAQLEGLIVLEVDYYGRYVLPGTQPPAWFNNYKESAHGCVLGVVPA